MLDAGQLSLIVRAGAGVNTIDVAAASRRGIYVSNCPGKNAVAVAELTFALMLALDRRIPDNVASCEPAAGTRRSFRRRRDCSAGRSGLIGFGNIGQEVARRARAFGMPVVVWSRRFATNADARQHAVDELGIEVVASPEKVCRARRHRQHSSRADEGDARSSSTPSCCDTLGPARC